MYTVNPLHFSAKPGTDDPWLLTLEEQRVQLPSNINNMPVVQTLEEGCGYGWQPPLVGGRGSSK